MDILNQFSSKNDLFKESMYSILKQMTFKVHKLIEPNYYGFDCFAKMGINDDIPTVVEFFYASKSRQVISTTKIKQLINNIVLAHKKLSSLKILLVTNSYFKKSDFDISSISEKAKFEIWDKSKLDQLMKEYPLDFYTFSNSKKGLSKYITKEVIENRSVLNVEMFKLEALSKKVSLVLGAGVSKELGGLDLNELTQLMLTSLPKNYLANKDGVLDLIGKSTLSTIHFVKENIGPKKYGYAIYKSLYGHQKHSIDDQDTTLYALSELLYRYPDIDSVITFNFDNYLEQALVKRGVPFKYLFTHEDFLNKSLPIYHVHGFLPNDAVNISDYVDSIILSEEDFFKLYSDNNAWQVSIQLEKYKDDLCLFVGSSLRDYNLKRCLQITKQKYKRHYAIMSKRECQTLTDMLVVNRYFNLFNIEIIWVDGHSQIPEILKRF